MSRRLDTPLVSLLVCAGVLLSLVSPVSTVADPNAVAAEFTARLRDALLEGALARDRLWVPGLQDSTQRLLDVRAAASFLWSGVHVRAERAREGTFVPADASEGGARACVDVELLVTGSVRWEPRAYGVAKALWPLQLDEEAVLNWVVRREAWRLVREGGTWLAHERALLSPVQVSEAVVVAEVHPDQDALVVDCTYTVRALADGVRVLRFLLDRRAFVYELLIDGEPAEHARGGELGALGLEGFTPEVESSLRFPTPLAKGEESVVKFRIRSPLVHMRGEGFVTSLPLRDGPFRERAWYPLIGPATVLGERPATVGKLTVYWPVGAFAEFALSGEPLDSGRDRREGGRYEEFFASSRLAAGDSRDADFLLLEAGVSASDVDWAEILGPSDDALDRVPVLAERTIRAQLPAATAGRFAGILDDHPRSRRHLIAPLVAASVYSTGDLQAELQDLLPIEAELIEELFDRGATDADEGAAERTER